MCVRAGHARGGGVWRGTCQIAHCRGRDRREHCPICGTDRRDRYTGTLGRSGLANAGTATRGPDERIHMRRPADQHYAQHARICMRINAYAYAYAHACSLAASRLMPARTCDSSRSSTSHRTRLCLRCSRRPPRCASEAGACALSCSASRRVSCSYVGSDSTGSRRLSSRTSPWDCTRLSP